MEEEKVSSAQKSNEISEIKQKATELIKNIQIYSKLSTTPSLCNKEKERAKERKHQRIYTKYAG